VFISLQRESVILEFIYIIIKFKSCIYHFCKSGYDFLDFYSVFHFLAYWENL
jgi:hypothetical protein